MTNDLPPPIGPAIMIDKRNNKSLCSDLRVIQPLTKWFRSTNDKKRSSKNIAVSNLKETRQFNNDHQDITSAFHYISNLKPDEITVLGTGMLIKKWQIGQIRSGHVVHLTVACLFQKQSQQANKKAVPINREKLEITRGVELCQQSKF